LRAIDLSAAERHPPIVETELHLVWQTEEDTQTFAQALALKPALRNAFIELRGDLGAGKTTLVRHLLRALGVTGRIKSPTYAVVEPHTVALASSPGGPPQELDIWHFDFYRFNDPREWEDAGFRDLFASPGLKLAEWPEQAAAALPTPDLSVQIDTQADDTRHVTLTAHSITGMGLLP
jgi:tRNA threonylcarbamoyladenosine biosynthesis protein TsaE